MSEPSGYPTDAEIIENEEIAQAAKALVQRLHAVHAHPAYEAVWNFYLSEGGGPYRGPTYTAELAALEDTLRLAGRMGPK